jgi:ribonuclease HI
MRHFSEGSEMSIVAVYTDGGCIGANPSHAGGTWAWCAVDENGAHVCEQAGSVLPIGKAGITNNQMEFLAVVRALQALPAGWCGTVYSDSAVTIGRMRDGWRLGNLPQWLISEGGKALKRMGQLTWVQLDGHPTKAQLAEGRGKRGNLVSAHNVWCDKACGQAGKQFIERHGGEHGCTGVPGAGGSGTGGDGDRVKGSGEMVKEA